MPVKKGKKKKKNQMLGVVVIVLFIAAAVLAYFLLFKKPEVGLVGADITPPALRLQTKFPTELFDDERFTNLILFGPGEVVVGQRGRTADPFKPF